MAPLYPKSDTAPVIAQCLASPALTATTRPTQPDDVSHSSMPRENELEAERWSPEDAESLLAVTLSHGQPCTPMTTPSSVQRDGPTSPSAAEDKVIVEDPISEARNLKLDVTRIPHTKNGDGIDSHHQAERDLPSPWRSSPRIFEVHGEARPTLIQNLRSGRLRSSSGSMFEQSGSILRKYVPFSMPSFPSLPKGVAFVNASLSRLSAQMSFAPTARSENRVVGVSPTDRARASSDAGLSAGNMDRHSDSDPHGVPLEHHRPLHQRSRSDDLALSPSISRRSDCGLADIHRSVPSNGPTSGKPTPFPEKGQLRRTNSDISLVLRRSMSTASSLGDDKRFEDVRDAVNSRFKALRDSMADSRIRLPNFPSILDVSLPSLRLPELSTLRNSPNQLPAAHPSDTVNRQSVPGASTVRTGVTSPFSPGTPSGVKNKQKPLGPNPSETSSKRNDVGSLGRAMEALTGDIVVLGGYRGSILRSAKPPHRQLWIPVKVGLNLRKADLEVGLSPEDEENMEDRIIPSGMLTHVGPVDISRRLLKRLRGCKNAKSGRLRVWDYGYDWRLSPHLLSQRFTRFLEGLPSNQDEATNAGATIIAHSLGGLITRHAVNRRPELFAGIVYAGVPRFCVNILGPLRNGDEVGRASP